MVSVARQANHIQYINVIVFVELFFMQMNFCSVLKQIEILSILVFVVFHLIIPKQTNDYTNNRIKT